MNEIVNQLVTYVTFAIPGIVLSALGWWTACRVKNRALRSSVRAILVGFALAPTKALATGGVFAPASFELFLLVKALLFSGPGFVKEGGLFPLALAAASIAVCSLVAVAAVQLSYVLKGRLPEDIRSLE